MRSIDAYGYLTPEQARRTRMCVVWRPMRIMSLEKLEFDDRSVDQTELGAQSSRRNYFDDPRVGPITRCRRRCPQPGQFVVERDQPTRNEQNVALAAVLVPTKPDGAANVIRCKPVKRLGQRDVERA